MLLTSPGSLAPVSLLLTSLFSDRSTTSLWMSCFLGKRSSAELFGFLMIKAYIFHSYHSPLFPKAWNSVGEAWKQGAPGRGWISRLSCGLTLRPPPEYRTVLFYTLLPACSFIFTRSFSLLALYPSNPLHVSEISAVSQTHKPQVFPPLALEFSPVPSVRAAWNSGQLMLWILDQKQMETMDRAFSFLPWPFFHIDDSHNRFIRFSQQP